MVVFFFFFEKVLKLLVTHFISLGSGTYKKRKKKKKGKGWGLQKAMAMAMAMARSALVKKYLRVNVGVGVGVDSSPFNAIRRRFFSEEVRTSFKSEVTDRVISVVKNFQKVDPSKVSGRVKK